MKHSLRLRLWKLPSSIEDFFPRLIEAHHVIPAGHNWQAVGNPAIADIELDSDRAIGTFLSRQVVERVGIVFVLLKSTLSIINRDRPEPSTGTSLGTVSL